MSATDSSSHSVGSAHRGGRPELAVVVATRNRANRLQLLLDALRRQRLGDAQLEVVVVDDGSTDQTPEVLAREANRGGLPLQAIRCAKPVGPAEARNRGWHASTARFIAFTDDDCEPAPNWLASGLRGCRAHPGCFVQGRTEPNPEEAARIGPFSRTMKVLDLDLNFPTCNIFYPREVLERIDGFDVDRFARWGGEDSDLAWRAIDAGTRPVFCAAALVHHAVNELGALGKLRVALRWRNAMRAYAVHPELRRATFVHGLFWKRDHYLLTRALLAAVLPRRWAVARAWLAYPYARSLWGRGRVLGGGPLLMPYYLLHDLVEAGGVVAAGIRHRTPML